MSVDLEQFAGGEDGDWSYKGNGLSVLLGGNRATVRGYVGAQSQAAMQAWDDRIRKALALAAAAPALLADLRAAREALKPFGDAWRNAGDYWGASAIQRADEARRRIDIAHFVRAAELTEQSRAALEGVKDG